MKCGKICSPVLIGFVTLCLVTFVTFEKEKGSAGARAGIYDF